MVVGRRTDAEFNIPVAQTMAATPTMTSLRLNFERKNLSIMSLMEIKTSNSMGRRVITKNSRSAGNHQRKKRMQVVSQISEKLRNSAKTARLAICSTFQNARAITTAPSKSLIARDAGDGTATKNLSENYSSTTITNRMSD